jgi:hypothetical protein
MGQGHIMSIRGLVAIETPPVKNVMAISNIAYIMHDRIYVASQ